MLVNGVHAQENVATPPNQQVMVQLTRDLGDPSYAVRTNATRQLCVIGAPATKILEQAAGGDDVEVALRAKAVLRVIDSLLFGGVEVRLAFSKPNRAWDEPVDLVVTFTNRSEFPARLPFESPPVYS